MTVRPTNPRLTRHAAALALGLCAAAGPAAPPRFAFVPTIAAAPGTTAGLPIADFVFGVEGRPPAVAGPTTGPVTVALDPAAAGLVFAVSPDAEGILPVTAIVAGKPVSFVIRADRKPVHEFVFKPSAPVKKVSVAGSFNGWNAGADPLAGPDASGAYRLRRTMEPGRHQYKVVVDDKWITDPANPAREPDGYHGFNSILEAGGGAAGAGPPRFARVSADESKRRYELAFVPTATTAPLDAASVVVAADNRLLCPDAWAVEPGGRLVITLPPGGAARQAVRVNARDTAGRQAVEAGFHTGAGAKGKRSTDWRDAIIYFAMTDRFRDGDPANNHPVTGDPELAPRANHMGGDWAGLRRAVREGYFDRLGVTALWISPTNLNAEGAWRDALPPHRKFSSYHGYWPTAPRTPNRRFGSMRDLRALVADAHARGLAVLADVVANHVHRDHPYYRDHAAWFGSVTLDDGTTNIRQFDAHPLTTWFDAFMPDFDYDAHPDALRAAVDDAVWWAREADFDGFRQDATKHVSTAFWRGLTRALRERVEPARGGAAFFQVGESIVGREKLMEYVGPGLLDGQFDFPLYWDIRECFATGTRGLDALARTQRGLLDFYGPWALNPVFLGNHDFGRFMAFADGGLRLDEDEREAGWKRDITVRDPASYEKLKLAFSFVLTQPQVPMIYYGDEIGMTGAGDPDNRRMMRFGDAVTTAERAVFDHVAALTRLRRAHRALRGGDVTTLHASPDGLVQLRSTFDERLLVAFNRSPRPQACAVQLPEWCPPPRETRTLLGGARVAAKDKAVTIELPPMSAVVAELR